MTSPPIRVETVPVRRAGPLPALLVGLAAVLVGLAIVKPWGSADNGRKSTRSRRARSRSRSHHQLHRLPREVRPTPAAVVAVVAAPVALLPGQVACDASDWEIVALGSLLRWTVRSWTPIAPVEASGAADPFDPGPLARRLGRRRDGRLRAVERVASEPGRRAGSSPPGGRAPRRVEPRRRAFGRVGLADLDRLPAGALGGHITTAGERRGAGPARPPATQRGRWPAGHYVLLLAAPDGGPDRWIAVDIGAAGT